MFPTNRSSAASVVASQHGWDHLHECLEVWTERIRQQTARVFPLNPGAQGRDFAPPEGKTSVTGADAVIEEMSLKVLGLVPRTAAPGSDDQFSPAHSPGLRVLTLLCSRFCRHAELLSPGQSSAVCAV